MTTAVTAYVCDFCVKKKRFANHVTAKRHEKLCFHNPVRRACISCRFLTLERYNYEDGSGGAFCEFELIPIAETPETPERQFTFDCAKWEPKH